MGLISIEQRFLDGDHHLSVTRGISNRHFFVALALFKIELVWGFGRLVAFMHNPPRAQGPGPLQGVIKGFWDLYDQTNKMAGYPSIPYSVISAHGQGRDFLV
jgi:hypothetical protein